MNKQLLSALVALALVNSVVLASPVADENGAAPMDVETQFSLFTDDQTETSLLSPERLVFREFCVEARDEAQSYLKMAASSSLKNAFNVLTEPFEWPQEIEGNANEEKVEIAFEANSEALSTEVKAVIDQEDGGERQAVAEPKQQSRFAWLAEFVKNAARRAFYAALDIVSKEATRRLQRLRSRFTPDELKQVVDEACENLNSELKKKLSQRLNSYKSDVKSSSQYRGVNSDLRSIIDKTSFDNVNCMTTKRITLASKFCGVLPTLLAFVDS